MACSFCWRDVEGRQHSFKNLDAPEEIATELISSQTDLIERHLPFALDNYENMIRVAYALSKEPDPISIAEIASRAQLSRMRVKDALNDLKNADVVLESPKTRGHFFLRDDLKDDISPSLDSSRTMIEKLVASRDDIINVHLEAANPKHVAISYDGEPTMYTRLGELIREFRKRNISTFVVTNGTFPERILSSRKAETCQRHSMSRWLLRTRRPTSRSAPACGHTSQFTKITGPDSTRHSNCSRR